MCDKAIGFIIGCFLCLCEGVAGQRVPIGEKCPDVLVDRFLSGSGGRQLSCFWEKPLLLHFWNTGCSSAEDYLLFIDSVEKNYRGRLEVLLVSYENSVLVEEFFRGVAVSGDFRFQTVVADSALNNLFPHRTEPHDVWIDAGGVVKAITGHTQLTGENLEKFIGGGRLCLLEKKEEMDRKLYFGLVPLAANRFEENKEKMMAYSCITGPRPELVHSYGPATEWDDGTVRMKAYNVSLPLLYMVAYRKNSQYHRKQVVTEDEEGTDGKVKEIYCYDLILRNKTKEQAHDYIIKDLDRFFGFVSSVEVRSIECFVLRRTGVPVGFASKQKKAVYHLKNDLLEVEYVPAWLVFANLNSSENIPLPFVNGTGFEGHMRFRVSFDFQNLEKTNVDLSPFGLELTREMRSMEVIVLRKTNGNQ